MPWRAQLQLWVCRITPAAWIREADKERQWLRGSCTQQVSNYIMSVLNILLQLSSFSLYQQRSCPLCSEWYLKSSLSWSQQPDLHVSLIRVSCQRQESSSVTERSRQQNRIQTKIYSCHIIPVLGRHRPHQKYRWSAEFILAVTTTRQVTSSRMEKHAT